MTSSTSSTGPVRCGGDGLQARPAFHFDKVALQLAVDFFAKRLRHGEGRWAGHRFTLAIRSGRAAARPKARPVAPPARARSGSLPPFHAA